MLHGQDTVKERRDMRSQQSRQSGRFKPSMTSADGSEKKLELAADVMHRESVLVGRRLQTSVSQSYFSFTYLNDCHKFNHSSPQRKHKCLRLAPEQEIRNIILLDVPAREQGKETRMH